MSKAMYLIVFDCDGTLVDSQDMIFAALSEAFTANGLRVPPREVALSIVGLSLNEAFSVLTRKTPDAPVSALAASYKDAFYRLRTDRTYHEPMFDGAREAIDALSARDDVLLGIATGKARRGVDAVLAAHGLTGRFASIQTADDAPSKPHPGMILNAMAETGAEPQNTVVVGDTGFDMAMARAAGARAIGVSWGYHPIDRLAEGGAETIIDRYAALLPAVSDLFAWERVA
ncbi:phosphoglycolate phosphatase [Rhodobium orientis]|nr:phosphoglycolate phosphatase [Rhodobium orientis]